MFKFLTIILLMSSFNFISYAGFTDTLFGRKPLAGPCTRKVEVAKNLSVQELKAEALRLMDENKYCESAEYFLKVMVNTLDANDYSQAWSLRIQSYFFQYDYENLLWEANQFLEQRLGAKQREEVHYYLVRTVYELYKQNPNLDNAWLQLALGVHPEQLNSDSPKQKLKLRNFLNTFPESRYKSEIQSYLDEIKVSFNHNYWEEAHLLMMKREYAPAIVRYQFLINQGPDSDKFGLSFYELLMTLHEFAFFITNEKVLYNEKVSRWLSVKPEEVTLEKRLELQKALYEQAKKIKDKMLETIPNDPWTIRAKRDFAQ